MRKRRTVLSGFFFDGWKLFSDDGEVASAILPLPRQLADAAGNDWVGYYPGSIYGGGQLSRYVQEIDFGSETVGSRIWPPMGSGQYSFSGLAARRLSSLDRYIATPTTTATISLTVSQQWPSCQAASRPTWGGSTWKMYFFFGGPGGRICSNSPARMQCASSKEGADCGKPFTNCALHSAKVSGLRTLLPLSGVEEYGNPSTSKDSAAKPQKRAAPWMVGLDAAVSYAFFACTAYDLEIFWLFVQAVFSGNQDFNTNSGPKINEARVIVEP
jgi:hypothetical protein